MNILASVTKSPHSLDTRLSEIFLASFFLNWVFVILIDHSRIEVWLYSLSSLFYSLSNDRLSLSVRLILLILLLKTLNFAILAFQKVKKTNIAYNSFMLADTHTHEEGGFHFCRIYKRCIHVFAYCTYIDPRSKAY